MNINLGTRWEEFISLRVQSGRYLSASEVVREGLRLLQEREQFRQVRIEQLHKELNEGLEQLERGEYVELDEQGLKEFLDGVKTRGEKRFSGKRAAKRS